jgi:hypothetical protein
MYEGALGASRDACTASLMKRSRSTQIFGRGVRFLDPPVSLLDSRRRGAGALEPRRRASPRIRFVYRDAQPIVPNVRSGPSSRPGCRSRASPVWRKTKDSLLRPWSIGRTGKALVFTDGVVVACEDDSRGEPHHEEIRRAFGKNEREVASLGVARDGLVTVYTCSCGRAWLAEQLAEHHPALLLAADEFDKYGFHK